MTVKYYTDEHDIRRAEVSPPYELFGWFLEDDVQGSLYHCQLLFSVIEKVKAGIESEWSGTGNAHTITITKDKAVIENEYLIESPETPHRVCEIPLIEFEQALTQWFQFIRIGQDDLVEWMKSHLKDEDELARIRASRQQRKLMEAKKKRARQSLKG